MFQSSVDRARPRWHVRLRGVQGRAVFMRRVWLGFLMTFGMLQARPCYNLWQEFLSNRHARTAGEPFASTSAGTRGVPSCAPAG